MVSIDDKRLQHAFLEEVTELLENLNKQLLLLEDSPTDKNVINEIFRMTHSIKSESALIGFKNISTISHKMEDIFERVRRGALIVDRKIMDALFSAFDRIMALISAIQNGESEAGYEIIDVVNPLLEILKEKPMEVKNASDIKQEQIKPKEETQQQNPTEESFATKLAVNQKELKEFKNVNFSDVEKTQIEDGIERGETLYRLVYHLQDDCDMRYPRAYLVYNNFLNNGNVVKIIPDIQMETEDEKFKEVEMYYLTNANFAKLKECADVDQVDRLDVYSIDLKDIHKILGLSSADIKDTGLSQEEIEEAERLEKQWLKQIEEETKKEALKKEIKEDKILTGNISQEESQKEKLEEKKSIASGASQGKELQKQTIRVDIERLDILMNLVGELIINRSRFIQIRDKITEQTPIQEIKTELEDATNELERITDQMQMGMMQARMVPIGNVFSKFPRMVRDLANSLHKNVNLEIVGETTEIDRTVIELIADPLTHLIRNSIDHGFETPEERQRVGKQREGNLLLKAFQEGSSIYIEVSDDGKGINIDAVKEKAVERGLVSVQQANSTSQTEILNFIFEPGFSTKKEVTNLSGRGVGMDVVRTQIEKLRGRVDITTVQGEGTKFTIILPLTLTIVEALLVNVQKSTFAIPISVVEETIKVKRDEIKEFDDYQVYNLRNETLAVIYLSDLVGLRRETTQENVYIVVVAFERRKIGLVVNDLIGEQDIVIKALDEVLKNNEGIAGASVLGDGKVALILDTSTLVKAALKEINKIADAFDFYSDNNKILSMNRLYDDLNKMETQQAKQQPINNQPKQKEVENVVVEQPKPNADLDKTLDIINQSLNDIKDLK
ncbi:MAG: hypothetical protein A2086_06395 [Spirochaetes bacterium GWD1_27_9]|nr:MAG: hypothetical protein A2Z98_00285 [Spirochaetes bacterium GWB1_27_13]OHD27043.1 MAG: hypothetical protein A2Y34_18415 [Spirochaetes bacterium GWC1_27_15]OHD40598.1 MAG: hypothetical protein A2086_06395 [Spirochaetes bacterium GWD1_27_9]